MGILKVEGKPCQPLHSFRADQWDFYPEVKYGDPDRQKRIMRRSRICQIKPKPVFAVASKPNSNW
jgi:hypothetical protein